ncbi:MAG: amidase [Alphaproteobacteria bacterium]|nr:amidase [Alphaproteobacteria bacterium]
MTLVELSAAEAIEKIRDGEITSEELVQACLDRIEQVDGDIEAWAHLNPDFALEQARFRDKQRADGKALGPLHGIPVGVKDIFDSEGYPTENGTTLDSGRQPYMDCRVITLLLEAGAVLMGKTVTTELAVFGPGKTKNPHNPAHTPGGSSSGSAAAVASYMVPLAVGSQTNGSTIRPASFCGIVGFKPTHGLIPRTGVLCQSPPLDTIGTFARSIEDVALVTETLAAYDPGDSDTRPHARPPLAAVAMDEPPMEPVLAFSKTPVWDQADESTQDAFGELVDVLGDECSELFLPEAFNQVVEMHNNVMCADLAKNFAGYYERSKDDLTDRLCAMIEEGQKVTAVDYNRAMDLRAELNLELDALFENYDAIIVPATPGEAPAGLDATGSPIFNTLWTFCGTPAVSLPLMEGPNGLPLGVQLVGQRGDDARLLRTATWLTKRLA